MSYYIGPLPPLSNKVGWSQLIEIDDADTGEPVDLTGASIVFEARDPHTGCVALSATTSNGKVSIVDIGIIQISATPSDTQCLRPGEYPIGGTITINGASVQLIIGELPVLDGVVSQL